MERWVGALCCTRAMHIADTRSSVPSGFKIFCGLNWLRNAGCHSACVNTLTFPSVEVFSYPVQLYTHKCRQITVCKKALDAWQAACPFVRHWRSSIIMSALVTVYQLHWMVSISEQCRIIKMPCNRLRVVVGVRHMCPLNNGHMRVVQLLKSNVIDYHLSWKLRMCTKSYLGCAVADLVWLQHLRISLSEVIGMQTGWRHFVHTYFQVAVISVFTRAELQNRWIVQMQYNYFNNVCTAAIFKISRDVVPRDRLIVDTGGSPHVVKRIPRRYGSI